MWKLLIQMSQITVLTTKISDSNVADNCLDNKNYKKYSKCRRYAATQRAGRFVKDRRTRPKLSDGCDLISPFF
jgi:hypothetical protein